MILVYVNTVFLHVLLFSTGRNICTQYYTLNKVLAKTTVEVRP